MKEVMRHRPSAVYMWACLEALALGILSLQGCSSLIKAFRREWTIKGSPDSCGVLLVDCRVRFKEGFDVLHPLSSGFDQLFDRSMADVRRVSIVDSLGATHQAESRGGVHLFSGLKPGSYTLRSIEAVFGVYSEDERKRYFGCESWDPLCPDKVKLLYEIPIEVAQPQRVQIAQGGVYFIGRVFIKDGRGPDYYRDPFHFNQDTYRVEESNEHEIRALKKLLDAAEKGPWQDILRLRIAELERVESGQ